MAALLVIVVLWNVVASSIREQKKDLKDCNEENRVLQEKADRANAEFNAHLMDDIREKRAQNERYDSIKNILKNETNIN